MPFDRRLQEMMNRLVNETFTPVVGPLATRTLRQVTLAQSAGALLMLCYARE